MAKKKGETEVIGNNLNPIQNFVINVCNLKVGGKEM